MKQNDASAKLFSRPKNTIIHSASGKNATSHPLKANLNKEKINPFELENEFQFGSHFLLYFH